MGPIADEQGVEQGGVNSTDFYKVFGKEQLTSAQASSIGPITEPGVGLADDTGLLTNSFHDLLNLLHLTVPSTKLSSALTRQNSWSTMVWERNI